MPSNFPVTIAPRIGSAYTYQGTAGGSPVTTDNLLISLAGMAPEQRAEIAAFVAANPTHNTLPLWGSLPTNNEQTVRSCPLVEVCAQGWEGAKAAKISNDGAEILIELDALVVPVDPAVLVRYIHTAVR